MENDLKKENGGGAIEVDIENIINQLSNLITIPAPPAESVLDTSNFMTYRF